MENEIIVKQRPHTDYPNLTVKHVESKEYMCPKNGPDDKLITGIDENGYEVTSIEDPEERKKQFTKIKKEREELERLLGVSLIPESGYWNKFYVVLEDEQTFDKLNPKHRLLIHFLVANRYVAPSLEIAETDDRYYNCFYYLFNKQEETSKLSKKQKTYNRAIAELDRLESTPNRLKIVAAYVLGYDPKSDLDEEEAYIALSSYINESEEKEKDARVKLFLDIVKKDEGELMVKVVLDKAINKHIISVRGNRHKREQVEYGNSYGEALEFLLDPVNSGELASLQKEVLRIKK